MIFFFTKLEYSCVWKILLIKFLYRLFNFYRCADENRKPRVSDFGDKVEDSTFLNQLQNGVNRWIKEIQKVTDKFRFIFLTANNINFFIGHQTGS